MSATLFQSSRDDGRSDRRVIYELAESAEPETFFSFEDIEMTLQDGVDSPITKARIYQAITKGNKTLLKERKRYLDSVAGRGYRVIRSDEHLAVAITKKSRAESQIKSGIDLLRNVRIDELSELQRTLHVGQLMVLDGVYRMAKASEKRHERQEQVLEEMRRQQAEIAERIEKLENVAA